MAKGKTDSENEPLKGKWPDRYHALLQKKWERDNPGKTYLRGELHANTGVHQNTFNIAKRKSEITPRQFARLARAVGMTVEQLRDALDPDTPFSLDRDDYHDVTSEEINKKVDGITAFLNRLPAIKKVTPRDVRDLKKLFKKCEKTGRAPYVFYHWRQKHPGIHWVDFYFISIIRELQAYGFEACALITESSVPLDLTIAVLRSMDVKFITAAEAFAYEKDYKRFAVGKINDESLGNIRNHKLNDAKIWLQFIPYLVKEKEKRGGYLQVVWDPTINNYQESYSYDVVEVVQISSLDIRVDGKLAKPDCRALCLDGKLSTSTELWRALAVPSNDPVLKEMFRHFNALRDAIRAAEKPRWRSDEIHPDVSTVAKKSRIRDFFFHVKDIFAFLEMRGSPRS